LSGLGLVVFIFIYNRLFLLTAVKTEEWWVFISHHHPLIEFFYTNLAIIIIFLGYIRKNSWWDLRLKFMITFNEAIRVYLELVCGIQILLTYRIWTNLVFYFWIAWIYWFLVKDCLILINIIYLINILKRNITWFWPSWGKTLAQLLDESKLGFLQAYEPALLVKPHYMTLLVL
jgi:hypothetical protein